MAIQWGQAQKVPPGMWAKAGKDSSGDPHILMGANDQILETLRVEGMIITGKRVVNGMSRLDFLPMLWLHQVMIKGIFLELIDCLRSVPHPIWITF